MLDPIPLWETQELRDAAGDTLRPGGFKVTDRAADLIGLLPGWRVLDVGSGLGATVGRLRSRYGAQAWGVEPSSGQMRLVKHGIGRTTGIKNRLIQARGDALPFARGSFRAVFCECVLSLFTDPAKGLDEFYQVLDADGFLVLADIHAAENTSSTGGSCVDGAIPLERVQAMVEAHGFVVRKVEDFSHELKELAAQLLMAGGDIQCSCERSPGYYLMIAQKMRNA